MSSETKSRAELVEEWRKRPIVWHSHARYRFAGNLSGLVEAVRLAVNGCADELEALESSSSADTGGREAYRRGVNGAIEIIRAYKLPPSSSLVRETANELIETIARDIEAHLESAEAYADCGPTRGADTGTTGAEGLDARLDEAKWWDENCGFPGRGAKLRADRIASLEAQRAATQRAPVTHVAGQSDIALAHSSFLKGPMTNVPEAHVHTEECYAHIHTGARAYLICEFAKKPAKAQRALVTPTRVEGVNGRTGAPAPVTTPGMVIDLVAKWNSEGKRVKELADKERSNAGGDRLMAQAVRFWECARELEEALAAAKEPRG